MQRTVGMQDLQTLSLSLRWSLRSGVSTYGLGLETLFLSFFLNLYQQLFVSSPFTKTCTCSTVAPGLFREIETESE